MNPEVNDSDYDPFARWRPVGSRVETSEPEEEDDADALAEFRPTEETISLGKEATKERKNPSLKTIAKDVAKQGTKEALIGLGGTWGDLLELAGVRPKEIPGEKEKNQREFDVLEKMNQPGYEPSIYDIESLTSDSDSIGPWSPPTSSNLRQFNRLAGGPDEAETTYGRYAGRSGRILGSAASLGAFNPAGALAAGVAGQAVEEAGGGPLLQAGAEIAALLLSPGAVGQKLTGSVKQEVTDRINNLRRLGYADEDITLAINSASKGRVQGVKASKGEGTVDAFRQAADRSNQLVSDILTQSIPGIQGGTRNVHQMASNFYGQVAQEAANLTIRDSSPFINSATRVVRELRQNLGQNPEATGFLNRIYDAVMASTQQPSARNFMEFYKELNSMGKWLGRSQRDRLINMVKDGIKDTFRAEGQQGRRLATRFEEANQGVRRAFNAEEVHDLIQGTATQDGIDFKKLYKLFDKPDNVHLFEDVLGTQQANNLQQIARTGRDISNFDNAWKALSGKDKALGNVGSAAYYFFHQNWPGLATALGIKASDVGIRRLLEESLTNPRFQNLIIRGMHAVRNQSTTGVRSALDAIQKELDDEGIDINLVEKKEKTRGKQ